MLIMLNCHNRPHPTLYNRFDAFFDLDPIKHTKELELLYNRATCCVLSYADITNKSGDVVISYWQYSDRFLDKTEEAWVMFGPKIGELIMPKLSLASLPEFEGIIANDGDFNRFSVKRSTILANS